MNEWQERLVAELSQVSDRIDALAEFIASDVYSDLADIDRKLLSRQLDYMIAYQRILEQRIDRF